MWCESLLQMDGCLCECVCVFTDGGDERVAMNFSPHSNLNNCIPCPLKIFQCLGLVLCLWL